MKRIWRIIRWFFSAINAMSCIVLLFVICPRVIEQENLGFDYMGVIVGILSLLVTILLGWNIWTTLDLKNEMDNAKKQINEFNSKVQQKENELTNKIEQLNNSLQTFKHYGYAITDFCQIYTKLEPEKKDYFNTYCKALNAFRNFLKTNEDLEWYADACISNMETALRLAKEKGEKCSNETNRDIQKYVEEIRKSTKVGFYKYWERIVEIENERKSL